MITRDNLLSWNHCHIGDVTDPNIMMWSMHAFHSSGFISGCPWESFLMGLLKQSCSTSTGQWWRLAWWICNITRCLAQCEPQMKAVSFTQSPGLRPAEVESSTAQAHLEKKQAETWKKLTHPRDRSKSTHTASRNQGTCITWWISMSRVFYTSK